MDLRDFIGELINISKAPEKASEAKIIAFLEDNNWFGHKPVFQNGKVDVCDDVIPFLRDKIKPYLDTPEEEVTPALLLGMLSQEFPLTAAYLKVFYETSKEMDDSKLYVADFLLYALEKDLPLYKDSEIEMLLKRASFDLTKAHGDYLTFFLSWLRQETKTSYVKEYMMDKRYTMDIQNEAYSMNEYLELLYCLYNPDYIEENEMYQKAAASKNYTDTWLYLSMHFICSLRLTDLVRIYHPDLPYAPELVLERIANDTFTDNEARLILLSITHRLCMMPLYPNKTAGEDNDSSIDSIKLEIPSSCEVHLGKLFALAEAHLLLNGKASEPIIRKISTYSDITKYMGEEIGSLFLESDFRSRSATKSYLQSIFMIGEEFDEANEGPKVKGYLLASLARSHKGSYGEFAETTSTYLKDAKFNGLTPEFIAFELLERGVLSFIPALLLKLVTSGDYDKLSVTKQTSLIKELNFTPLETEALIVTYETAQAQADLVIREMIESKVDIMTALHRIGSGQAASKEPECLCLITATGKICPYGTKRQCVGCKYEISTKSTLFLLVSEYNRLSALYSRSDNANERSKYKYIITKIILPKLNELLSCLKSQYGDKVYSQYEELIKEYLHDC